MFFWKNHRPPPSPIPTKSKNLVEELQKIADDANERKRKEELDRRNDRLEYIQDCIKKSAENGYFSYWDGDWPFGYYSSMEEDRKWIVDQLKSKGLTVKIDLKSHNLVVSWEKK